MIAAQNVKRQIITAPGAIVDDASLTTTSVDTKGWDYCTIVVLMGATDIALTALKVQESDDDGNSDAYADVSGLVFGTSTDIDGNTSALPSATDDNNFFVFEIDLRGRERYLDLVCTVGDGTTGAYVCAWAELSRGENAPVTATAKGAETVLRV